MPGCSEWGREGADVHDGSVEVLSFIRVGSRRRLQIITRNPTENMTMRLAFLRHDRFNFQSVGIGSRMMIKSWKILNPAAMYTAVNVWMHFTGGVLYIQFVQLP